MICAHRSFYDFYFLYWHNVLIISRTSALTFPYNTFRLYFGINTTWYWHFHRVCDKLLSSILDASYGIWFGFRHLTDLTIGGFPVKPHASAYSVLPSIAGGLSMSIIKTQNNYTVSIYRAKLRHYILSHSYSHRYMPGFYESRQLFSPSMYLLLIMQ